MSNKDNKYYQGRYFPKNPEKYRGDVRNIIYRSSWERRAFRYCDLYSSILEWNSEEIIIPYRNPIDGAIHRYFPDLWIKYKAKNGTIKEAVVEIKPYNQTYLRKEPQRKTAKYMEEARTYAINRSKWDAAEKWCNKNGMEFHILTERELGI